MVSLSGIIGLGVAALLSVCWPVLAYFICRGRTSLRARNILVGAGCFIVFALVLEALLHYYTLVANQSSARWFMAHPVAFAFYGAFAAGLFEETARLFGLSFLVRREDGVGVAYGIGHGGAEAILVGGLGFAQSIVFAVLLNQGNLQTVLARAPAGTFEKIQASLDHLTFLAALPGAVERASVLVFQVALSLLVWRAVKYRRGSLFVAAIFAHAAMDMPAGMIQVGILHLGAWTIEAIYGSIAGVLLVMLSRTLPPRRSQQA